MKTSLVVGCDAVDAGEDWLRLGGSEGAVQTIPWAAISRAALPGGDAHMTFGGELEPITKLGATHDALWIEAGDNVSIALLEKVHPRRDSIVNAFKEHLDSRWLGDRLTGLQAAEAFLMTPRVGGGRGIPKVFLIALGGMVLIFVIALLVAELGH